MLYSFIKASALLAFGAFTFVSPALAVTPLPLLQSAATLVSQNMENQELQRDLQTDEYETPPEAAVGNEGQKPRRWEKVTNQADCEEAAGLWDARANRCIEKKM